MAKLDYFFLVSRYLGPAFGKPVRTVAAHPIAAAERVMRTRLYLVGDPENLFAEVSYINLDGDEERVLLYHGATDQSQLRV